MAKEKVTKAIVIRTTNYRENDKILTLFSLEYGKISATLRGCNKPNAKLKFAGQLFCFAEFNLVQMGENFVVTNASEIESFFDVSKDYIKLSMGTSVLEVCDTILNSDEPNPTLFVEVLKAFKVLCFSELNPKAVIIKFLLDVFKITGYQIQMERCQSCGGTFNSHILLDLDSGFLVCGLCRGINCLELSLSDLAILKMIDKTEYERLSTIKAKEEILQDLIVILNANWNMRFQHILKSLKNV